ncbi:MAG: hypothetical protein IKE42_19490 [Aquamicrobium sp.]|uniref:hypothetical protein n=1 Tax=Mesorhizobium sp. Pch-S TaxID=2082387 RepID=UPI0010130931|nr:hypothetical protein [Mesorhizobium sp. Pch-S]MBR2690040.1 hypothetical protein [Aquamicrobium sp.]QAZ47206.1 hypothetical protein C1M53_14255 [Mesorhizobium sp. Pch-S]
MADHGTARPVSGEIMTAASSARNGSAVAADVVDADFIVLGPDSPTQFDRSPPQTPVEVVEPAPLLDGMGMLRKGETAPEMHNASPGGPLFWSGGVLIALLAFWVSGGHVLFHENAFFGPDRVTSALSISGVSSRVDSSGHRPVLLVDGEAGNDGMEAAELPPLEIRVTGNDGRITRYGLGTSGRTLPPGERFAFSSRLDVPRNGVTAVSVTFAR